MNRNSYIGKLSSWNGSARRKPLILEGARQVGKTWLMREFSRTHYQNVVYVRFDKDKLLRRIFDADFDVDRIVHELEIAKHVKIKPETTILLLEYGRLTDGSGLHLPAGPEDLSIRGEGRGQCPFEELEGI